MVPKNVNHHSENIRKLYFVLMMINPYEMAVRKAIFKKFVALWPSNPSTQAASLRLWREVGIWDADADADGARGRKKRWF